MVSPEGPDFTSSVEPAGWPGADNPTRTADYGRFLDRLEAGQQWAFRLTANPVTMTLDRARNKKVRVPHVTVTQQTKWFTDRAEANGFSARGVLIDDHRQLEFLRNKTTVTLASASYRGTIRVADPALLRRMCSLAASERPRIRLRTDDTGARRCVEANARLTLQRAP